MSKTRKSEATRLNIMKSALAVFRAKGFENTTMRLIAKEAEIAPGTIYIHYASKEEIILEHYTNVQGALYEKIQEQLFASQKKDQARKKTKAPVLADALKILFEAQLKTLESDKHFLSGLAGAAASVGSPVSPFSEASAQIRKIHLEIFQDIIEHSKDKIDPALKEELPALLWMVQMGLIFFWLHDDSQHSRKSLKLTDDVIELIATMIKLHNNPLASSLKKTLIRLTRRLMSITQTPQ